MRSASNPPRNEGFVLSCCNFLSKGWEVSILGLLAFIQPEFHLPLYMVGILSTVFIASQIVVSLFAGRLAHLMQGGNVVLLAIVASGLSWLTLFLSHHTGFLYLAYALAGMSSGLFEPIGNSLVARRSSAKGRGAAIGNFAAYGDMGRIAMVAATTALAGWFGVNNASAILLATAVCAFPLASAFLVKSVNPENGEAQDSPIRLADLLGNRKFGYATMAGIADSFSSASLYIFIPFLLTAKGIGLANTVYFDAIFFAGYMSGRLVLGRLADRYGPSRILIQAELLMAALIVLLTLASGTILIVVLLFALGIFTRGTSPIIRAMVADSVDTHTNFHDAFSAYSFASRSSSAICRPIYGYLASYPGISSVFYVAAGVSLLTVYPALRYSDESAAKSSRDCN